MRKKYEIYLTDEQWEEISHLFTSSTKIISSIFSFVSGFVIGLCNLNITLVKI